jgi:hypothetical protein
MVVERRSPRLHLPSKGEGGNHDYHSPAIILSSHLLYNYPFKDSGQRKSIHITIILTLFTKHGKFTSSCLDGTIQHFRSYFSDLAFPSKQYARSRSRKNKTPNLKKGKFTQNLYEPDGGSMQQAPCSKFGMTSASIIPARLIL